MDGVTVDIIPPLDHTQQAIVSTLPHIRVSWFAFHFAGEAIVQCYKHSHQPLPDATFRVTQTWNTVEEKYVIQYTRI